MKNLGKLNYFLGISIQEKENGMILSQELYRKKVLAKFEKFRYGKGVSPIVQILESNEKDNLDQTNIRRDEF